MEILQLIMLAIIVESVWETSKLVWEDGKLSIDRVGALLVGLAVSLVYQVDLIVSTGITSQTGFLGYILTGILISRGGNYIHDLIDTLGN